MLDKNIIFEKNNDTKSYFKFPLSNDKNTIISKIPQNYLSKKELNIPNVSENETVRHFVNLSNKNYGVDSGFYPLGSCTMKYNPKINEKVSSNENFTNIHPYSSEERSQGNLKIMYECSKALLEITGMDDITLAPCAGAHGELTGLYLVRAYFESKNENRTNILIPDSAHGTNPASASMAGFKTINIKSTSDGFVDLKDLEKKADSNTACFMITNPNTLGLFEKEINKIVKICKKHDIQLYYDGANLNAFLGIVRPGDMGFDIVHMNLHKTFSTPHGGGGPGSGPVSVKKHLSDFLPGNNIIYENDIYKFKNRGEKSIGKMRSFYSNFLIVLRALVYIKMLGHDGLAETGLIALLNANYLGYLLKDHFDFATKDHIMHEFVITLSNICKENNITIMDFAKRILDYGYHSPTVSFPLIIPDCLMIEPTETETKENLEKFAEALIAIKKEAETNPDLIRNAPINTPIKRADSVKAAREPILKYQSNI